jgi:gliding motility-associated-like protein
MMTKRLLNLASTCMLAGGMFIAGNVNAQITTNTTLTPQQLVTNVLLGPGVIASNITYTGASDAIGFFENGMVGTIPLGIDSGVVMTTGTVLNNGMGPQGPNNATGAGTDNAQPGDAYLTTIAGANTFNAAILEFDFIPMSDSVKFRYVFGTDEYMEYVSGGFADVFAFVLSGVSVPLAPTNIALIPSTTTPVTALNVNANTNPQYYVDNENPPGTCVQYDGFTTVLTAQYPVQCGETYHIRLAIADALDGAVDAGVFLEAGSFTTGQVSLATEISYGSNNDSTLYEGCGQACVILARTGNTSLTDTVSLTITGTATNGVDFVPALPSTVIFQPGQDSVVICLSAIQDGNPEGLETLIVNSSAQGPCVQSVTSLTLYMSDFLPLTANAGPDTAMCTSSPVVIGGPASGGVEPYTYIWNTGATTPTITVNPTVTTTYFVMVTDPCGSPIGVDSVTVYLPSTQALQAIVSSDLEICAGDDVLMTASATGGSQPYFIQWTTYAGPDTVPNPNAALNTFTPTASGLFVVTIQEACGAQVSDSIAVVMNDCAVLAPNVFTPGGDGINDLLVFDGLEDYPNSQLFIFNRWGNKIYEDANYQNNWNGAQVVDGTYYYVLILNDGRDLTGFVSIINEK